MKKAVFFLVLVMVCGIGTIYFLQYKGSFSFAKPLFEGFSNMKTTYLKNSDNRLEESNSIGKANKLQYHSKEEGNEVENVDVNDEMNDQSKYDNNGEVVSQEVTADEIESFHNINDDSDTTNRNLFSPGSDSYDLFNKHLMLDNQRFPNNLKSDTTKPPLHGDKRKVVSTVKLEYNGEFKKRFPQVIIAGVKKCGTRALISFLAKHPMVRSAGQEVHFFDKDINYDKGLQWYLSRMPESYENEITVEKTPGYFVRPHVPERIHEFSPNVKIILIFRDPVVRAISDYAQSLSKRNESQREKREFEKQVFLRGVKPRTVNRNNSKIAIGLYSEHLRRWLHYFPLKQFLFLDGDGFIKNPAPALIQVQKFLNLPLLITEDSFVYNADKGFYCVIVKERRSNDTIPGCLGPTKGRKQPFIKNRTKERLNNFYRPYNKEFFTLIQSDFGWPT